MRFETRSFNHQNIRSSKPRNSKQESRREIILHSDHKLVKSGRTFVILLICTKVGISVLKMMN